MRYIICLLVLLLSGCNKRLLIGAEISSVKSNHNLKIVGDNKKFEDHFLSVSAIFKDNEISLVLKNISDNKIIIHWPESALIDGSDISHRILFATLREIKIANLSGKTPPTKPTILPSDSLIAGFVLNADNEINIAPQYMPGSLITTSGKTTYIPGYVSAAQRFNPGIINKKPNSKIEDEISANMHKKIRLIMAVEAEGKKFDYNIDFKINHVSFSK